MFFAADLIFWHHAIEDVGAGLATVLGNLQVVIVPFVAWALLGERIERRILVALPLVCIGVVLVSGALESGAYGEHPARGVVFGFLTRRHLRGLHPGAAPRQQRPAPPRRAAVRRDRGGGRRGASSPGSRSATPTSSRAGPRTRWLLTLALTSQVLGWLLITVSLPRLPAALTSVTLTIQPVGSVHPRRGPARRGADAAAARRRRVHRRRAALDRLAAGTRPWTGY